MWSLISRHGTVAVMVTSSFLTGYYIDKYSVKRVNAATAQLPSPSTATVTIPQPLPSHISDIGGGAKVQPSRASEIMRYGYPGFDNLRTFEDYVLSYDRRNRTAHWVVEHLSPDRLIYDQSVDRSKCVFHDDPSIHPFFRSTNNDYKVTLRMLYVYMMDLLASKLIIQGSGYDRGHLAAAGNHRRTQNAIEQTFLLSNMSPQVGKGFNRDKWNELEKHIRSLARKYKNVYICTGPLYLPKLEPDGSLYVKYKVIGQNNVAVPTHFFKVALIEVSDGKFDLEIYILPNAVIPDDTPLTAFMVPLDTVERAAGFLIFDKLPKGALRKVNGKSNGFLW